MATSGRSLASAVLIGVALLLFIPAFADAHAGFTFGSWEYGPQVKLVLKYIPTLLAVIGVAILAQPLLEQT